jgi:small nuclear ribonucleoprotein (snRNP)-like protein
LPKELAEIDRIERMNEVVTAYLKGDNPTQIAKITGLKRAEVLEYIEEWRVVAQNNKTIQARATEALTSMDEHYNMIIRELWETMEQADLNNDFKLKATVLKSLADVEGKRVDLLQKAGLLDNQQIGDEVVEMEKKHEILIGILREVTSDCPHCKVEVARRLSRVTGKTETIVVP